MLPCEEVPFGKAPNSRTPSMVQCSVAKTTFFTNKGVFTKIFEFEVEFFLYLRNFIVQHLFHVACMSVYKE